MVAINHVVTVRGNLCDNDRFGDINGSLKLRLFGYRIGDKISGNACKVGNLLEKKCSANRKPLVILI